MRSGPMRVWNSIQRKPRASAASSAEPGTGLDVLAVRRVLHRPHSAAATVGTGRQTSIPVYYDGADLREVADRTGLTPRGVIDAHTAVWWRVQFMGFAPGFGYLVPDPASAPDDAALFRAITRRSQSRPSVPAGSVAVAAGYSAVYPRSSPGGWFLLGRTALTMWNSRATPPSTLTAGTTVRFDAMPEGTVSDPSAPTTSENTK